MKYLNPIIQLIGLVIGLACLIASMLSPLQQEQHRDKSGARYIEMERCENAARRIEERKWLKRASTQSQSL